jgi:hypothetical protein
MRLYERLIAVEACRSAARAIPRPLCDVADLDLPPRRPLRCPRRRHDLGDGKDWYNYVKSAGRFRSRRAHAAVHKVAVYPIVR